MNRRSKARATGLVAVTFTLLVCCVAFAFGNPWNPLKIAAISLGFLSSGYCWYEFVVAYRDRRANPPAKNWEDASKTD